MNGKKSKMLRRIGMKTAHNINDVVSDGKHSFWRKKTPRKLHAFSLKAIVKQLKKQYKNGYDFHYV